MIRLKKVSYSYKDIDAEGKKVVYDGVSDINLHIKEGECVVLCGKSGCGKTTLLRMINGLIPHFYEGEIQGDVSLAGMDVSKKTLPELSEYVGSVFQNPRSQFFHLDTTGELAFNIENRGMPVEQMKKRVDRTVQELNLDYLTDRNIFELSGGEKQRIACGTVYAAETPVVVFDEPSSNLDVESIFRLKNVIEKLKRAGKTIVLSEHRLWYLWGIADRYVYMEKGRVQRVYTKEDLNALSKADRESMGIRAVNEAEVLNGVAGEITKTPAESENAGLWIEKLNCYRKNKQVLAIENLQIPKHAVVAVIGGNGVGKSTFCYALSGLLKSKGRLLLDGKAYKPKKLRKQSYLVMQEAGQQLFADTVEEELRLCDKELSDEKLSLVLEHMHLSHAKGMHPGALSGGEKQRLALATAACTKRLIRFYDEPTSGQDMENLRQTVEVIRALGKEAEASFVVTHDLECISQCATHILYMKDGKVERFWEYTEENKPYVWEILKERN